jgi:hypothetical protein
VEGGSRKLDEHHDGQLSMEQDVIMWQVLIEQEDIAHAVVRKSWRCN